MKIIKSIILVKLCLSGVFSIAQNTPCPRPTNPAIDMVCDYSSWNWENTNPYDSSYCKIWTAKVDNNMYLSRVGSPFVEPIGQKLNTIRDNGDFLKENGWDLIGRDFGCIKDNAMPYLILYKKDISLLRIYAYLSKTASPKYNYNKIFMGLETNENIRPAAQPVETQFKDFNYHFAYSGKEKKPVLIYKCEDLPIGTWLTGEFSVSLDGNQPDINKNIQFSMHFVMESDVPDAPK